MKKQRIFLSAVILIALVFVLFSCEEGTQAFYKVKINPDNGDEVVEVDIPEGTEYTIPSTVPDRENYTFDYWVCNDVKYKPGDKVVVKSNLVFTAVWKIKAFTVTFMDGTEKLGEKTVDYNTPVSAIEIPTREGYIFDKWLLGGGEFDFSSPVKEDLILTASWTIKKVTVTFKNGENEVSKSTIDWGTTIAESSAPNVSSGALEFKGWYEGDTKFDFSEPIKEDITLTAKWLDKDKVSVTVKYGNGNEEKREEYNKGINFTLPDAPKYEGYDFIGWSVDDAAEVKKAGDEITLDKSITITANWEIKTFTVKFDTKEGTAIEEKTVKWGESVGEVSTTRDGYDFVRWLKGTDAFDLSTPIKENITLIAEWKIKKFTVTFMDGATEIGKKTVEWNNTVTAISTPTKEGYTFYKWLKDNSEYNFSTPVKNDLTLTASWNVIKYEVTFVTGTDTIITSQSVEYGKTVSEPTTKLEKTGYYLDGWLNGTDKYDFSKGVYENLTLKANWEKNKYTVEFKLDDSSSYKTVEVYYDDKVSSPTEPTKEGHTFEKWMLDEDEYNFDYQVTGNITLVASWTLNKVTVTFKNGENVVSTKSIDWGTALSESDAPTVTTSDEMRFDGWYKGDTKFDFSEPLKEDITLTAHLVEKDKVWVTFKYGNGNDDLTEKYALGSNFTLPKAPVYEGYDFLGWSVDDAAETKAAGEVITLDKSITITAKWKIKTFTVKFDTKEGTAIEEKTVKWGESVGAVSTTKEGYDFVRWLKDTATFDLSTPIKENITLIAEWKIKKFTVTFMDGATEIGKKTVEWNNTVTAISTPTKEGYTFYKWLKDNSEYNFSTPVKNDLTLTASWNVIKYEVTFVTGTDTIITSQSVEYGKTVSEPTTKLEKTGYYLDGWLNGTDKYDFSSGVYGPLTLNANWVKNVYTVEFTLDDSSNYEKVQVSHGDKVSSPKNPTKEGHTFEKWMLDEDEYNFDDEVTGNITLVASWTLNKVTVTFKNGDKTFLDYAIDWGNTPLVPSNQPDSSDSSQKFLYWSEDGTNAYNFNTPVKADIVLKAVFGTEFVVAIDYNDGQTKTKYQYFEKETEVTLPQLSNEREGFRFMGWYDQDRRCYEPNEKYIITKSVVITAAWEKIQTHVIFTTYCDTEVESQTIDLGGKVTDPGTLKRDGSEFLGWYYYDESGYLQAFDFETPVTTDFLYLYAKWDPECLTVTFNPANGEEEWEMNGIYWDSIIPAPSDPVYSGKTFAGWYVDENTEFDFSSPVRKSLTLTAHWVDAGTPVEGKCVVTYDFGDSSLSNETITVKKGTTISVGNGITTYNKHPLHKEFAYWKDEDGNNVSGQQIEINEDRTFTAVWKTETIDVYYRSENTQVYSTQIKWGDTIVGYNNLVDREGYTFKGWSLSNYGTELYDFNNPIEPDYNYIVFYAVWTPDIYTVEVNPNNGTDSSTTLNVEYGTILNLPTPEKDGYRFLGWYNGETKFDARTESVKETMTLVGRWEKVDSFNVYFCYLDGVNETVTKEVAYKGSVTAPDKVDIEGLVFAGWYIGDSTFEPNIFARKPFDFSQEITGDIYLYAKYILREEKIKGEWSCSSGMTISFLEEGEKKIIKASSRMMGGMVEMGTWEYYEETGKFSALFTGDYASFMVGPYPALQALDLGASSESLVAMSLYDSSIVCEYTSESGRTPSSDNVIGTWRAKNGEWTSTAVFGEKAKWSFSLNYDEAEKNPVSTSTLATPYQFINEDGISGATFADFERGCGFSGAKTEFSTSLTFAAGTDNFYLIGLMLNTETPMTRVSE